MGGVEDRPCFGVLGRSSSTIRGLQASDRNDGDNGGQGDRTEGGEGEGSGWTADPEQPEETRGGCEMAEGERGVERGSKGGRAMLLVVIEGNGDGGVVVP